MSNPNDECASEIKSGIEIEILQVVSKLRTCDRCPVPFSLICSELGEFTESSKKALLISINRLSELKPPLLRGGEPEGFSITAHGTNHLIRTNGR